MSDERQELLDWLETRGFTTEQLRDAPEAILPFLAAERVVMQGPPVHDAIGLAELLEITVDDLQVLRRSQGLPLYEPDEVRYSEAEVESLRILAAFTAMGIDAEQMADALRVLGRGFSHASQVMRAVILEIVLEPGVTERELAERYEAAVQAVMPSIGPMLDALMRQHLRNMIDSEAIDAAERVSGRMPGARDVTIAFADLVGFTRMGEELEPEDITSVAARLEVLAAEAVTGEVRMVKTIGDAAMFAGPSAGEVIAVGLRLAELVDAEGEDFPQVKVGVATGQAQQRGGDWFGRPVNLASRVTSIARAGSVLVTSDARDGDFAFSFAGERKIRGVSEAVKLFRARPARS